MINGKLSVYLAGFICGRKLKECIEWRNKLKNDKRLKGLIFLDPFQGKDLPTITPEGLKSSVPGAVVFQRDFISVKNSDILVVNLDTFGDNRPPVGTLFEMAWAYLLRKPIITIAKEAHYKFHPFIANSSSVIVPKVEDAVKHILYYQKIFRSN